MRSSIYFLLLFTILTSFAACNAQINNANSETVKIYGNCGMCKSTIEKAGYQKDIAKVEWNKASKMAKITYDKSKTNLDEILKRISLSGYDSDKFRAPDKAYNKLHECCHYERPEK